jgi:hypothetical protein
LFPKEWAEEATTIKILQSPEATQSKRDSSDWLQGYCYQFWRSRHNSFRGDGAFGQYILVLPEQDAVIAITAETPDMQGEINLVWEHLLPAIKQDKLAPNKTMDAALRTKLASLALPIPGQKTTSTVASKISGKTFLIQQNKNLVKTLSLDFTNNICYLSLNTDTANLKIGFSADNWQTGTTTKVGPYLLARAKSRLSGLPPFKVAGHYNWKDENTLEFTLRYIESPHTEKITCHFDQNNIAVDFESSINKSKETIVGEISK